MSMTTPTTTGKQIYANYDALWHLQSMGVLDADQKPNGWDIGEVVQQKTRVAIIDTSVAFNHPCLNPAINHQLAIDVFSARLGSFPGYEADATIELNDLNLATDVAENLSAVQNILNQLQDRLSAGSPARFDGIEPMTSSAFSNHGTAVAGLVGARPVIAEVAADYSDSGTEKVEFPLPYVGVDPFCELVPISTNFDDDPAMMIVAFLYAELIDADVILLPRDIPDPLRTAPELNQETVDGVPLGDAVRQVSPSEENRLLWEELTQLIVNISQKRPIVCAAGNSQEEFAIYPANLASEHNGIISVGAINAKGHRSGYSALKNLTVMAPSNDSQLFDRHEVRLDEQDVDYSPVGVPEVNANAKCSHYDIISTDVPGRYGYAYSPFESDEPEDGLREFGSYFCRFGGTSASSALVAGFLSLGFSTGAVAKTADGLEAKNWLISKCEQLTDGDETYPFPVWYGSASFPDS